VKTSVLRGGLCLLASLSLGGCAFLSTSSGCDSKPYMHAEVSPPLQQLPGLDVPKPNPDMAIPNVPDGPIGWYGDPPVAQLDSAFGDCLYAPPPMPTPSA